MYPGVAPVKFSCNTQLSSTLASILSPTFLPLGPVTSQCPIQKSNSEYFSVQKAQDLP